jgi:hypothetical protein
LPAGYQEEAEALREELAEEDEKVLRDAFAEGRSSVLRLASAARWEAWRAARRQGERGTVEAARITARLEAIDEMLSELQ